MTAFDDATDIEVITYSLRDPEGNTGVPNADGNDDDTNIYTPSESDGHARHFDIDVVTGQITVSDGARLDADGDTNPPYTVVVRAVDGDGDVENITVRIHAQDANEPPAINRVYVTGSTPSADAVGDRAPTEMSHYELDRDNDPATEIDTNLDTAATVEPATYYATDPEDDTGAAIEWSLDGDDAGDFSITAATPPTNATLSFASGPDFENPGDDNKDNVYKVTIVASASGGSDMLPVTVKVLNSTDDNAPGSVTFENRQPEVKTALKANFEDSDEGVTNLKWQWYRAAATTTSACDPRTPVVADSDPAEATDHRFFVENDTTTGWTLIAGATSATYTPTEDDFDATVGTNGQGYCLRATVTYRDGVDRTHSAANVSGTLVDETLEAAWAATEQPVKAVDEKNDDPRFTVDGTNDTDRESVYRAREVENGGAEVINEALAAVDLADDPTDPTVNFEDDGNGDADGTDDLLTYSLSGRDHASFTITGTIDHNEVLDSDLTADGTLTFNGPADYEGQQEYRVVITATDPSNDSGSVTVIVDIDNENEPPGFTINTDPTMGRILSPASVRYAENATIPVGTYHAVDPEGSGITYSLVDDANNVEGVEAENITDVARFNIGSITGILSFKASPNFERPVDADTNNMYQVAVRADVADESGHFAIQIVTVTVGDVNEAPMFSETMDTLQITENPDDPDNEPPLAAGYLYLLNRGAGIPSPANPPAAPNLDVGIPMAAIDDDNTRISEVYTGTGFTRTDRPFQHIDSLTYELSGADAGYFDIVPATGQILTVKKLDYEAKDQFTVTVKATDPEGLSGSTVVTIDVLDVDEVPVPDILRIAGESSYSVAENGEDALGEYTVRAGGDAVIGAWTREGADASHFMVEGSGSSIMLKFASPPDYDAMADADGDNVYEVTLKNTDPSDSTIFDTFAVTVTVTDVDELGSLNGPRGASTMEGVTESLGTYMVTGGDGTSTATLSLEGVDAGLFTLGSTGMDLMFASAPDYESPMGGANDDSTTYIVTVKAEAGGEMETVDVTVMVENAEEGGTVTLTPPSAMIDVPITASVEDGDIVDQSSVAWSWARGDNADGTGFEPIAGEASATYTPVEADAGMYLMATATYTDGYDAGNTEEAVSTNARLAAGRQR